MNYLRVEQAGEHTGFSFLSVRQKIDAKGYKGGLESYALSFTRKADPQP